MRYLLTLMMVAIATLSMAQSAPERGEVRRGNKDYLQEDYASAAERYAKASALAPKSFEAKYNLGNALFKGGVMELQAQAQQMQQGAQGAQGVQGAQGEQPQQPKSERMEEAERLLTKLAADSLLNSSDRSEAYYNLGNSQFMQQKFKEALESYKQSMRMNPDDQEAKYNYAFTKKMLEQQQQQEQQQGEDNQEGDDEQEQDNQQGGEDNQQQQQQQQQQNEQDGEQEQNEQQGEQDEQEQNEQEQEGEQEGEQQQPQPQELSDQEQQMLDAIQAQEDKTQDKLEEEAQGVLIPGGKNW